ncbi:MAG: fatty acid hydroxylase, partial [Leptothrix sp. (in: Bacteria)]|nr:fatty acid hydroxylase [Leptothrix sp. (in: b-proteobacteria)]
MEALASNASLMLTAGALLAYLFTLLWERARPLQSRDAGNGATRWAGNFGLFAVNHAVPYLVVPVITAFAAWWSAHLGLGLMAALGAPAWAVLIAALLSLDLMGWLLHRAMHRVPLLWRVHQVHHSDLCFDAALAFRFHPGEAALAALASSFVVVTLGLTVEAVLASSLLGALHNVFVHANASLGAGPERAVRAVFVTPDLHRVHHSAVPDNGLHNYGIVFSCWDRLFRTWRAPEGSGPQAFGMDTERDPARMTLPRLLLMPFRPAA